MRTSERAITLIDRLERLHRLDVKTARGIQILVAYNTAEYLRNEKAYFEEYRTRDESGYIVTMIDNYASASKNNPFTSIYMNLLLATIEDAKMAEQLVTPLEHTLAFYIRLVRESIHLASEQNKDPQEMLEDDTCRDEIVYGHVHKTKENAIAYENMQAGMNEALLSKIMTDNIPQATKGLMGELAGRMRGVEMERIERYFAACPDGTA